MNREEIKHSYSMREIVERYGFHVNRAGFIHCPFHKGDKGASLKIYPDSFHCFGCGASGDIFTFVQLIDHVDFKEAFQSLGGEQRKREEEKLRRKRELNNVLIDVYRNYMNKSEPFSEVWCDCCNALQYQLYLHEILNREEVRK